MEQAQQVRGCPGSAVASSNTVRSLVNPEAHPAPVDASSDSEQDDGRLAPIPEEDENGFEAWLATETEAEPVTQAEIDSAIAAAQYIRPDYDRGPSNVVERLHFVRFGVDPNDKSYAQAHAYNTQGEPLLCLDVTHEFS